METRLVTSTANPVVKMLKSLSVKKYREEEGLFLVEGARHMQDALSGGYELIFAAYGPRAGSTERQVTATANDIIEVTDEILSRITGRDNPQSVIGAFRIPQYDLSLATGGLWVALEGIRDPGNLGTIIRTADAAGAAGIILLGNCCDPYQPEAIRGSMGSFGRIKTVPASLPDFLAWRKNWPGTVVGTHLHRNAGDFRETAYKLPLLLLMGSESQGLSPEAVAACDTLVKIPMLGGAESLNLAVSTALMLYEIQRDTLK
jgi:TrmH family RNA methyltransferase